MAAESDVVLESFCGSRTRLLTMSVLASAEAPLSGYRIASVAGLPREKVYPELQRAIAVGSVEKTASGFVLIDTDMRSLLTKRVRVTWDNYWDRSDRPSTEAVDRELEVIRQRRKRVPLYNPANRIPKRAIRELERDPEKDRALIRLGLRPSSRKLK
jgi:hypothetical protein